MKHLEFWFDPVSPYAYLAFEQLPQALEGISYRVDYQPILFAGLLKQWGQKGPAEIEPKRAWTFRQIAWAAHQLGIPIATPAQHPFNPLALLRLLHGCAGEGGTPNRWQCERVFHHVWRGEGADANDAARLQALRATLAPQRDLDFAAQQRPGCGGQPQRAIAAGLDIQIAAGDQLSIDTLPLAFVEFLADAEGGQALMAELDHALGLVAEQHVGQMADAKALAGAVDAGQDRKSTRLNSSH